MQAPGGAPLQETPTGNSHKADQEFEDLKSSPTPIGSHWARLTNVLLEKDNSRCEVWKGEFQNVLIFAGLFSAVVTAFLVESYKWLKKDTAEALLTYIAIQMGEKDPRTLLKDTLSESISDGEATLINSLWFVSLVLSLATVLIGTVALQWLGEHQRSHVGVEPQIAFSLRHMQVDALDAWFVPRIFPALCLILQASVILFLIGLTRLLWDLNRTVFLCVAAVVGASLFFLLFSSIMPTLQVLSMFIPQNVATPRHPCPYKTPQGWVFHNLVSFVINLFARGLGTETKLLPTHRGDSDPATFPQALDLLFSRQENESWLDHGVAWLFQRDRDYMSLGPKDTAKPCDRLVPLYDAVQGLVKVRDSDPSDLETIAALDLCTRIVTKSNRDSDTCRRPGAPTSYKRFFRRISTENVLPYGLPLHISVDTEDGFDVLASDAALRLCSRAGDFQHLPSDARQGALQHCIDITEWMYGGEKAIPYQRPDHYIPAQTLPITFVAEAVCSGDVVGKGLEEVQRATRRILDRFLSRVAESTSVLGQHDSLDTHDQYAAQFLKAAIRILSHNCEGAQWDELLEGLKLDRETTNEGLVFQIQPFVLFLLLDSGAPPSDRLRGLVGSAFSSRDEARKSRSLPLWRFFRWEVLLQVITPAPAPPTPDTFSSGVAESLAESSAG